MTPANAGQRLTVALHDSGRTALSLAEELGIPQSSLSVMQTRGCGWRAAERWIRVLDALGVLEDVREKLDGAALKASLLKGGA